jgi:hypothetical protein
VNRNEYTRECFELAEGARMMLEKLSKLMKENGDAHRAMDIDEAIDYINGAMG